MTLSLSKPQQNDVNRDGNKVCVVGSGATPNTTVYAFIGPDVDNDDTPRTHYDTMNADGNGNFSGNIIDAEDGQNTIAVFTEIDAGSSSSSSGGKEWEKLAMDFVVETEGDHTCP